MTNDEKVVKSKNTDATDEGPADAWAAGAERGSVTGEEAAAESASLPEASATTEVRDRVVLPLVFFAAARRARFRGAMVALDVKQMQ